MSELKDVEIFAVGTWRGMQGTFKFIKGDLTDIVKNTQTLMSEEGLKPKLKLGHSSKQILQGQTDGDPALGFLGNARIKADKIISDFKSMPDIIYQAIKRGLYTSVSAELEFRESPGWFIRGVALLGADIPAVKTLDDLRVFLSESGEDATAGCQLVFTEPTILNGESNKMSEEKAIDLSSQRKMLALEKQLQEAELANKGLSAEILSFSENDKARIFAEKKKEFLTPYQEKVKAGCMTPALFSKLEKAIEGQGANFSEGQELMLPQSVIGELVEKFSERMPKGAEAEQLDGYAAGETIDERVVIATAKVQSTNANLTFKAASDIMFTANPGLAREYNDWAAAQHGRGD